MRATFESIVGEREQSFAYRVFGWTTFPFKWHFHPEIELTLIRSGHGQRFVGDDIDTFSAGDLVLLGRDLPHTWMSSADLPKRRNACQSVVIQFRDDCFGKGFFSALPELARVQGLLRRAGRGLCFDGPIRDQVATTMIAMQSAAPFDRMTMLLQSLDALAQAPAEAVRTLSSEGFRPQTTHFGRHGIGTVLAYLNRQYTEAVRLETVADMAHLSPSAFSRFFQRSTGKSFTDYLTELRVGRACELMIGTDRKISAIGYESGFNNLSNFNRQFLKVKRLTPRAYREQHWKNA